MSPISGSRNNIDWLHDLKIGAVNEDGLRAELSYWQASGVVLATYIENELLPKVENRAHFWTDHYFFKQVEDAKRNFSLERAEHLLVVQAHLQQQRVRGFAKDRAAFSPTSSLSAAGDSGDVDRIRTALVLELADARLDQAYLHGAIGWVADVSQDTFVPYKEGRFMGPMKDDVSAWSVKYYDEQSTFLDSNFSRERFWHQTAVRQYLREKGVGGFAPLPGQAFQTPARSTPASASSARSSTTNVIQSSGYVSTGFDYRIALIVLVGVAALSAYFFLNRHEY